MSNLKWILFAVVNMIVSSPAYSKDVLLSEVLKENFKTVVILMEGDKLIDEEKIQSLPEGAKTMREKLEQFASLGDYSLQRYESSYLLSKKYTHAGEIPCTTDLEILDFSKKAKKAIALLLGDSVNRKDGVKRIVDLLTEEQVQKAKDDVLPVASLNSAQKESINQFIFDTYFSGLTTLAVPTNMVLAPDRARICIDTVGDSNKSLCYKEPQQAQAKWSFGGITEPTMTQYKEHKRRNISFFGSTIATVSKILSDRPGEISYICSPIIAEKPISIVNLDKADSDDVWKMIAKLYNLRAINDGNVKKLDVKNTAVSQDTEITKYLTAIAPPSLIRAYTHASYRDLTQDILKQVVKDLTKDKKTEVSYKELDSFNRTCILLHIVDNAIGALRNSESGIPQRLRNSDVLGIKYSAGISPVFKRQATTFTLMTPTENGWQRGLETTRFDPPPK